MTGAYFLRSTRRVSLGFNCTTLKNAHLERSDGFERISKVSSLVSMLVVFTIYSPHSDSESESLAGFYRGVSQLLTVSIRIGPSKLSRQTRFGPYSTKYIGLPAGPRWIIISILCCSPMTTTAAGSKRCFFGVLLEVYRSRYPGREGERQSPSISFDHVGVGSISCIGRLIFG